MVTRIPVSANVLYLDGLGIFRHAHPVIASLT